MIQFQNQETHGKDSHGHGQCHTHNVLYWDIGKHNQSVKQGPTSDMWLVTGDRWHITCGPLLAKKVDTQQDTNIINKNLHFRCSNLNMTTWSLNSALSARLLLQRDTHTNNHSLTCIGWCWGSVRRCSATQVQGWMKDLAILLYYPPANINIQYLDISCLENWTSATIWHLEWHSSVTGST